MFWATGQNTKSGDGQKSPSLVITPQILKDAVRSNIVARIGTKKVYDPEDDQWHDGNLRYLWPNLPEQYANRVNSVSFKLKHKTFPHPYFVTKEESSIFLFGWKGYNCVDEASVTANLVDPSVNGGKPVSVDFDYCRLGDSGKPMEEEEWLPLLQI